MSLSLRRNLCGVVTSIALLSGCQQGLDSAASITEVAENQSSLTVDDGSNWMRFGRTWKEDHYSPLTEINEQTVSQLSLDWYRDLPAEFSSGVSSPLAVDGVLFFAVGHSKIHAVDAISGELLWRYDPKVSDVAGHKMRAGWGIRGIAYDHGKIFFGTLDGRLIALNAEDGAVFWSAQTTMGPEDGRYITGQPYVMNGKVIIGHGGADYQPVRGYVSAYDTSTGELAWRFYTVPGNPADGFENEAMKKAAETWSGEWWKFGGGGTSWNSMAYDPELNIIYVGTGNGAPWNQKIRSPEGGDNLFLCSIVALNADTGEYLWHYQTNPGETWDFNSAMGIQLADIELDGKQRKVILHAPKNGFFYVIDRVSGEFISAEPFAKVTWAEGIDAETGRPIEIAAARYPEGTGYLMFPSAWGAHGVEEMAFNHQTGLVYLPVKDQGEVYANPPNIDTWQQQGIMEYSPGLGMPPEPIEVPLATGWLSAWDPVEQREVWRVDQVSSQNGGVLTTAGNLVFQGNSEGELVAFRADSGESLWRFDAQNGIQGHPITYEVDGRQYLSILVGWRGATYPGSGTQWDYRQQQPRLLTFSLSPSEVALPKSDRIVRPIIDDPSFEVDDSQALKGLTVYFRNCVVCHGVGLQSWGAAPDLKRSPMTLSKQALQQVLQQGALKHMGMPQYQEMTDDEVIAIQHYVRQTARQHID